MNKMFPYEDDDIVNTYNDLIYVVQNYGITARAFVLEKHRMLIQTRRLRNVYLAESWAQDYINSHQSMESRKF